MFDFCVDEDQFTKKEIEVWQSLVHVSAMAKRCFWITTPPETATRLYNQNTCEVHAGCPASLALFSFGDMAPTKQEASITSLLYSSVAAIVYVKSTS